MGRRRGGLTIHLKDGTGTVCLKYLSEEPDRHGNVRMYFRRFGKRIRLRASVGTPEFLSEYKAVLQTFAPVERTAAPARNSLRWLIQQYFGSADFTSLAHRTQYVRRRVLEEICAVKTASGVTNGDKPYALMEPRHVSRLREEKRDKPGSANQRVKFLRQVFKWAIDALDAKANPAREVPYLASASEGFHTWTADEVRQYWAHHPLGTKGRLAMDLLLFTGVRRSDVVTLGPQMERDGNIAWTEVKGRRRKIKARELPILPQLRASIDACPSGHLTYIATAYGKPFTANGFGNWFRDRCDEA